MIDEIEHLPDEHTAAQIADIFNARGMTPSAGASFHRKLVARAARTSITSDSMIDTPRRRAAPHPPNRRAQIQLRSPPGSYLAG